MLAALIRPIFAAQSREDARGLLSVAVEALERLPKVAAMLEAAKEDVLAFPAGHCRQLRSTNPLERLNRLDRAADRRSRHLS